MTPDETKTPGNDGKEAIVGYLTADLRHEFNNLLQGIIGLAEIIELDESLSEEGTLAIRTIQELGEDAHDLIQDVEISKQSIADREKRFVQIKPEVAEAKTRSKQKPAILVVEDDHLVLNVVTRMLKQLGHNTLTARSGTDALDLYRNNAERIELVITDMKMPNMGGLELAEHILTDNPETKIVVMSGYLQEDVDIEPSQFGLAGWLEKPMTADRLRQVINSVIGER
ncbi:MAG: response regulator [Candidatus Thorarchaeota archaeon]|nr:response regulator [Candidatus Thorarchaeota archaeon]